MYPNGKSDIHPDATKLIEELKEIRTPSSHFLEYDEAEAYDLIIKGCESPIEQMMAVAMAYTQSDFMHVASNLELVWFKNLRDGQKEHIFRPDFVVGLNWTLLTPEWEYASRGDWWDTGAAYQWLPFFAVECDGRDYHNDHEAIERDKQRDRIFAARGMQVLRYTGSEIYNNTLGCADEIRELFNTYLRERLRPGVGPEELVGLGTKLLLGKKWEG